jgi:hypothetical protein
MLAGALLVLPAGCAEGPVDDVITASLFVPPRGSIGGLEVVVPKGRVIAFVAQPMGAGETLKTRISLESADTTIAVAEPTTKMNQFVVVGLEVGTTTLLVKEENGQTATPTLSVEVVSP